MAMADYCLCAMCAGKAFYDAGVDYGSAEVLALCAACAKHYRLSVRVRHVYPAPAAGKETT